MHAYLQGNSVRVSKDHIHTNNIISNSLLNVYYRSLPGKHPWALYHNMLISPYWALTRCTGCLPCAKIEIGGASFVGVAVS